jgi:hypothetical protein
MNEPKAPPKPRSASIKFLRIVGVGLLITLVLMTASVAAVWLASKFGVSAAHFDAALRTWRPLFLAGQLTFIALLWWYWNAIVTWLWVHKYGPTVPPQPAIYAPRHRIALALLAGFLMGMQVTA